MKKAATNAARLAMKDGAESVPSTADLPRSRGAAAALGASYYFTGRSCKHGHLSVRYTKGGCIQCTYDRYDSKRGDTAEEPNGRQQREQRRVERSFVHLTKKPSSYWEGMAASLLPDRLWSVVEPLLPPLKPAGSRGRPQLGNREALTGILFVLKAGIPWENLPKEMGCGSGMTCSRRQRDWQTAGVWDKLQRVLGRVGGNQAD